MNILEDLTLRSSILMLLGLTAHRLLRRRSAALRHAVLAGAILASAVVVPLSLAVPAWAPAVPAAFAPAHATVAMDTPLPAAIATTSVSVASVVVSPTQVALCVWAGGVLVGITILLIAVVRLHAVARRGMGAQNDEWTRLLIQICAATRLRRPVAICHTAAPDLLATFGLFHPRVLLPLGAREWNAHRIRVVLSHELAHVQRCDWAVQIGADLVRIVYWFNPLFWFACTRLRRDSERACDDVVLGSGVAAREYAAHLLDLARTSRPWPAWGAATSMAGPSTLERRFAAMLNPLIDRRPVSRRARAAAAALLTAVTIPIAALHARQTTPLPLGGWVYDATGAVLPSVKLVVEDAQQNRWRAETDANGRFEFPALGPGAYTLRAELQGFRALTHEFQLRHARDWDRAITLQVGVVHESISVRESRGSRGAIAAPSGSADPVRVGGNIRIPRKLTDVRPVYPASMREAGREGVVPIEAVIGVDGAVHAVRVLSANIHPDFAVSAVDAVRQWRFAPTLLNGEPVEVTMVVNVAFSLSDSPE